MIRYQTSRLCEHLPPTNGRFAGVERTLMATIAGVWLRWGNLAQWQSFSQKPSPFLLFTRTCGLDWSLPYVRSCQFASYVTVAQNGELNHRMCFSK